MVKNSISEIKGNFDLMKKTVSKLGQRFGEHIDKILFIVSLFLVVLAVAVIVSENIASCLQKLLGLNEKYDVLKTIGYCIAGVLLVWQAWVANKRTKAMEATAKEQAKAMANTEARQRQEQLKNAIEHLGHDSNSVRMGGAYEIFHLAKDTGNSRQTALDLLCAHIRKMTRRDDYQAEHKTKPSEEIQSLLTLLFIEEHDVFKDCSINLQGSCLNGATLNQSRLKKANLRQVQLQRAVLIEAQLQEADLMEAQLQGAVLRKVQLQSANLREARLQGANLWGTQLQRAVLIEAQLQGAILIETQLQGATLFGARLQEADLSNAQLQGAFLMEAQLQGANFSKAQLQAVTITPNSRPPRI